MRLRGVVARTAMGIVAGGVVLMGGINSRAEEPATARVKHKASKAAAALKEETTSALQKAAVTKEEYQMRLKEELEAMKPKIEELKRKAAALAEDARANSQEQLAVLEKKRKEVEERLAKFSKKSEKAWAEMKTGLDAAVDDLKKAYDEAKEKFKQP